MNMGSGDEDGPLIIYSSREKKATSNGAEWCSLASARSPGSDDDKPIAHMGEGRL